MTEFGITPDISVQELETAGVNLAIWPVSNLRISLKSMEKFYSKLIEEKSSISSLNDMFNRSEFMNYYNTMHMKRWIQTL